MNVEKKKFKVGDLVSVDHSDHFDLIVTETPNIRAGIVMRKMKARDFYVVYYQGKYHKNVYVDWMRRLQ